MNTLICSTLKSFKIIFIVLIIYRSNSLAQKMSMGFCPAIEPMEDFDLDRYMGIWYQQASIKSLLKALRSCVEYKYTADNHGGFHVESKYTSYRQKDPVNHFGYAKPEKYHGFPQKGAYKITLFSGTVESKQDERYLILNTDYESYSLVWGCRALVSSLIYRGETLQILSRKREFNTSIIVSSYKEIIKRKMEDLYQSIETTNQTECELLYQGDEVEDSTVL